MLTTARRSVGRAGGRADGKTGAGDGYCEEDGADGRTGGRARAAGMLMERPMLQTRRERRANNLATAARDGRWDTRAVGGGEGSHGRAGARTTHAAARERGREKQERLDSNPMTKEQKGTKEEGNAKKQPGTHKTTGLLSRARRRQTRTDKQASKQADGRASSKAGRTSRKQTSSGQAGERTSRQAKQTSKADKQEAGKQNSGSAAHRHVTE